MTFCFFSAQYLPTVGGVERYTMNLARRLVRRGHRAVVVTSALPGLPACETGEDGVRVLRAETWRMMNGRFPVLTPRGARQVRRALAPETLGFAIDFAVVQTRLYPLCAVGARWAKKHGVPAIVLEHGTAHLFRGGVLGALGNAYEHLLMRCVRRSCHDFYGVSRACCDWLAHFGVHTRKVLYNAVDPDALRAEAAAADTAFLAPYVTAQTRPVLAFAGRFIPEKGVLPLLEAFALVRETHPAAVLLLAGDGPQMEAARAALPAGAALLGMLPHAESLALLQRADWFCLPTFSEGFCTSVLEAAALRCAVLTTPTGGSPELIADGESGMLLRGMDADSVTAGLARALDAGEAWRAAACEKAYETLCARFTWDSVCDALLETAAQKTTEEGTP